MIANGVGSLDLDPFSPRQKQSPEFSLPNEIIDFSTPKHNNQHNALLPDEREPGLSSLQDLGISPAEPTVSLPPVESIVTITANSPRPREPSGRQPPNSVITKLQAFAVPGSTDNRHILTNRPMTFQTASGKFRPPSTLLYGFQPMTTPLPPSSASSPSSSPSKPSSSSLDVRLQRKEQQKGRRRPRQTSLSSTVLKSISNFLQPITRLMSGL